MIGAGRLEELRRLIAIGEERKFYYWAEWQALRLEVLRLDKYECCRCRERGKYRKARIVHHVKHVKDRPDLALSVWDEETKERQLESVCKQCHEELHPESQRQYTSIAQVLTNERWD